MSVTPASHVLLFLCVVCARSGCDPSLSVPLTGPEFAHLAYSEAVLLVLCCCCFRGVAFWL